MVSPADTGGVSTPKIIDPILDNNTLTALAAGKSSEAAAFVAPFRGALVVNTLVWREFVARWSLNKWQEVSMRYGIQVIDTATEAQIASVFERTGMQINQKRWVDASIVANAEAGPIGLITGDKGVLAMALRLNLQLDPNIPLYFRIFEGTPEQIAKGYQSANGQIESLGGGVDPATITGR